MAATNPAHQYMSYDGTRMETLPQSTVDNMYNLNSYELAERVRQIKSVQLLQKELEALTNEARDAMLHSIKGYLRNEVNNKDMPNPGDLTAMSLFFSTYGSDNFWKDFYTNHSKNSLVPKILHFIIG
jgi:hypothetical protein